jgi:hypothetical protein
MAIGRGLLLGLSGGAVLSVLVHVVVALVSGGGGVLDVIHGELAVEVVDVAKVSRSAARVELSRPERDLVVGGLRVRRIFSRVRRQDSLAAVSESFLVGTSVVSARHPSMM